MRRPFLWYEGRVILPCSIAMNMPFASTFPMISLTANSGGKGFYEDFHFKEEIPCLHNVYE